MKAESVNINRVLSDGGDIHYILPHFQREYTWELPHWKTLLEDAFAVLEEMPEDCEEAPLPEHFLGALVVINDGTRSGTIGAFKLVDGQQRLVTVSLALCALGRLTSESNKSLSKKISKRLINADEDGDLYYKLLPTTKYGDRAAYMEILGGTNAAESESRIPVAFQYIIREIGTKLKGGVAPERLFAALTSAFHVVLIDLAASENPYRIFESLNAKGKPLTQADLVRNYIAMMLPSSKQESIFRSHWEKIEGLLHDMRVVGRSGIGELTAFLRHYLAMETGVLCSEEHVYGRFRDRMNTRFPDSANFGDEIKRIHKFAVHYDLLLRPNNQRNAAIRDALLRLQMIEGSTAYPFLLAITSACEEGKLSEDDFLRILVALENYLMRRFLAGEPTNFLNKVFPGLWSQLDPKAPDLSMMYILSTRRPVENPGFRDVSPKPAKIGSHICLP